MRDQSGLFPLRFLGFGLFWGWFFLMGISPSPLVGVACGYGGVPFEVLELAARLVILAAVVVFSHRIFNLSGRMPLAVFSSVAGACATALLVLVPGEGAVTLSSVIAAASEASMFLMWVGLFGYMRLGETLMLLVSSYSIGAAISLAAALFGETAMSACGIMLPLASGAALIMSQKFYLASPVAFDGMPQEKEGGALVTPASLPRLALALACYSFAFALYFGSLLAESEITAITPLVEPASSVVLVCVCLVYGKFARDPSHPYLLYRVAPACMGAGLALSAAGMGHSLSSSLLVALGFLLFEALAYNDFCNVAKVDNSSLLKGLARARFASSAGMLSGWALGYGLLPCLAAPFVGAPTFALALLTVLGTAVFVFTDRNTETLSGIADDRAMAEATGEVPSYEERVTLFADALGLSKRELEVAEIILAGRTTAYAAKKLFVAESTVRAHVHNIYRKAGVHTRMELMDEFDRHCGRRAPSGESRQ